MLRVRWRGGVKEFGWLNRSVSPSTVPVPVPVSPSRFDRQGPAAQGRVRETGGRQGVDLAFMCVLE